MIPLLILAPLAIASGGALGLAHERFRKKRLAAAINASEPTIVSEQELGSTLSGIKEADMEAMASGDLVQIKHAGHAARIALGVSAIGLYYPPITLISLPIIGYSAFNWLRTRYLFEQPWHKSPLSILAILALAGSLVTGHWLMASLVLSTDLAARKWLANWTKGARLVDKPKNETEKAVVPSGFIQRFKYLVRIILQGEPRWEWFPALLARVSMGLFFAISGWNKLFTAAHWKGLLSAMIATGLPFPKFMAMFLASIEFYGGALLTIGFMSTFFSIALAFAMIVAIVTVEIPFAIPPGLGPLDWLDWFLYLPQVLYVIIFFWLIVKGPGPYSVDALIARKLGVDKDEQKRLEYKPETTTDSDQDLKSGGSSWSPQPA